MNTQAICFLVVKNEKLPFNRAAFTTETIGDYDAVAPLLQKSVFRFFEASAVDRVARSLAKQYAKSLGRPESEYVTNLRLYIEGSPGDQRTYKNTVLLCGSQALRASHSANVIVVSFSLTPTRDALNARQLRSSELMIASSDHFGFADIAGSGRKEELPASALCTLEAHAQVQYDLVKGHCAMPRLLFNRLRFNFPVMLGMLCAETIVDKKAVAVAGADDNDDADDEEEIAVAPAVADAPTTTSVRNDRETAWLKQLFESGAYTIKGIVEQPINGSLLSARSTLVNAPFDADTNCVHRALWQLAEHSDEDAPPNTWPFLFTHKDALTYVAPEPIAPPTLESPAHVAEEVRDLSRSSTISANSDAVVDYSEEYDGIQVRAPVTTLRYEPLRYFAHSIEFAALTLYELEVYARTRLFWHLARVAEYKSDGAKDASQHWLARRYPQSSGAKRSILALLGREAVQREAHHEAIGMAVLALIAASSEQLRESFLFAEALALEVEFDASPGDMKDAAVDSRLSIIERFWERCAPIVNDNPPSAAQRILKAIARDWSDGLAQLNR